MKDETLHTLSVAWLAAIVGCVAGAFLGIYALAAIVSVTAIVAACIVAGRGLGNENEE